MSEQFRTTEQTESTEASEPVKEDFLTNVYVLDLSEESLICSVYGVIQEFLVAPHILNLEAVSFDCNPQSEEKANALKNCYADIRLTEGKVVDLHIKNNIYYDRVLGIEEKNIILEQYGTIPISDDFFGYRMEDSPTVCLKEEIPIGAENIAFVMGENEMVGFCMRKGDKPSLIRVLIQNSNYRGLFHSRITLSCEEGMKIEYRFGTEYEKRELAPEELLEINTSEECWQEKQGKTLDRMIVTSQSDTGKISFLDLERGVSVPKYRGKIEVIRTEEGMCVINELPVEDYLLSVLPSEMPASYPEEALKAQAICARTYAYGKMLAAGFLEYGAHVDDSTSYQVYNNCEERPECERAIADTAGTVLMWDGDKLAETFYYSTSCGLSANPSVWGGEVEENYPYLRVKRINTLEDSQATEQKDYSMESILRQRDLTDYEVEEPWYRWEYAVEEMDLEELYSRLSERFALDPEAILTVTQYGECSEEIRPFKTLKELRISDRNLGGAARELLLVTDTATYKIHSEYNIRYILCDGKSLVCRGDGSQVNCKRLLPSGFFVMEVVPGEEISGFRLIGGGYGHGVGMSQNAAKVMAKQGMTAEEILFFFYDSTTLSVMKTGKDT